MSTAALARRAYAKGWPTTARRGHSDVQATPSVRSVCTTGVTRVPSGRGCIGLVASHEREMPGQVSAKSIAAGNSPTIFCVAGGPRPRAAPESDRGGMCACVSDARL